MKTLIGLCCVALLSYGIYLHFVDKTAPIATGSIGASPSRFAADDPRNALSVFNVDWRRGGYGLAAVVDVAVKNNNAYPVQIDRIACSFRDKASGKIQEHSQGVYGTIPANGQKVIKDVGLGFVSSDLQGVGCSIAGARKG